MGYDELFKCCLSVHIWNPFGLCVILIDKLTSSIFTNTDLDELPHHNEQLQYLIFAYMAFFRSIFQFSNFLAHL